MKDAFVFWMQYRICISTCMHIQMYINANFLILLIFALGRWTKVCISQKVEWKYLYALFRFNISNILCQQLWWWLKSKTLGCNWSYLKKETLAILKCHANFKCEWPKQTKKNKKMASLKWKQEWMRWVQVG